MHDVIDLVELVKTRELAGAQHLACTQYVCRLLVWWWPPRAGREPMIAWIEDFIKDPPLCDIFYCYIQFLFLLNTQVATIMFAFASRRGSAIARTRIQSFGVGNRERGHLKTDRFVSVLKPSYTFWSSCFRRADLLLLIQTVAQVELVFSNESPHFWSGLA